MSPLTRPDDSSFAPADWELLSRYWHPVSTGSEVSDQPMRSVLLDIGLVVWRGPDGSPVVARDRCPHRGALLSAGCVKAGELQCPYHGFTFGDEGKCTSVPSAPPDSAISSRLDLLSLPVVERYGLIWTCLSDDPAGGLPDWHELEGAEVQRGSCQPGVWNSSALRHSENFNDLAHFAFVHTGTFGLEGETAVPPLEMTLEDDVISFEVVTRMLEGNIADAAAMVECDARNAYRWTLPFCTMLEIEYPEQRIEWIADVAAPVTASTSRVYVEKSRNFDLHVSPEDWVDNQEEVNAEDRRILGLLDPPITPLDLRDEVHVKADTVSIAARRWFRAQLERTGTRSVATDQTVATMTDVSISVSVDG